MIRVNVKIKMYFISQKQYFQYILFLILQYFINQMNLLEYQAKLNRYSNIKSIQKITTLFTSNQKIPFIYPTISSNTLLFTSIPISLPHFNSFLSIHLKSQLQIIILKLLLTQNTLLTVTNSFQITFLIRKLFKLNYLHQNYNFFIHPNTGQLCFSINLFINQNFLSNHNTYFTQYLNCLIFDYIPQIVQVYQHIFQLFPNLIDFNQQASKTHLSKAQQCKKYIKHSGIYTWSWLNSQTIMGNQKFYCYQKLKQNYKNLQKLVKVSDIQKRLTQVLKTKHQMNQPFDQFSQIEDNQIRNQYYAKDILINHQKQFILKLNLPKNFLAVLKNKNQFKINSNQGQYLAVIHRYPQSSKKKLVHYRNILNLLPPQIQFPFLPKYFIPKNMQKETQLYIFTNLSKTIQYKKYWKNNSKTMSIFTKFHLFYQIIVAIQYLRDYKIVYNALCPNNIYIKNGLVIQLFNFQNSYSNLLDVIQTQFQNNFPYYFIDQNFVGKNLNFQQRCDVMSFLYLCYEGLFNKQLIKIKQSKKKQLNKNFDMDYQQMPYLKKICFQKSKQFGDPIFQLLDIFCLSGYSFKSERCYFEQRPYLDWVVMIIRFSQLYFMNLV